MSLVWFGLFLGLTLIYLVNARESEEEFNIGQGGN